jgi:hypothetical protein
MERKADRQTVPKVADRSTSIEGERSPLMQDHAPVKCTDGSLVIDANGVVRKATPEQQQKAVKAREAREARRVKGDNDES